MNDSDVIYRPAVERDIEGILSVVRDGWPRGGPQALEERHGMIGGKLMAVAVCWCVAVLGLTSVSHGAEQAVSTDGSVTFTFEALAEWPELATFRSDAAARTGRWSLKLDTSGLPPASRSIGRIGTRSKHIPLKPLTWYRFNVWLARPSGFATGDGKRKACGVFVQFHPYDADQKQLTGWGFVGGSEISRAASTRGEWIAASKLFQAPAGTATAKLVFGAADNGMAYIDDVRIEEIQLRLPLPSCAIAEPSRADSPTPALVNGRWWKRGRPFIPVGFWAVPRGFWGPTLGLTEQDVAELSRLHLNTVVLAFKLGWLRERGAALEQVRRIFDAADKHDVGMILNPMLYHAPREQAWDDELVGLLWQEFGKRESLIGWMLLDDAVCDPDVVLATHRNAWRLRERDRSRPFFVDFWDIRHEKLGAAQDPSLWRGWLDGGFTYTYPAHGGGKLDDVQSVIERVRARARYPHLTYIPQAFTHDWYRGLRFTGPHAWNHHPLPLPEQMRLMSWYALQRGVAGLTFFAHHACTREQWGEDRLYEAALLGIHMELVGDFLGRPRCLAASAEWADQGASHDRVEAAAFAHESAVLVVLTRHGSADHSYFVPPERHDVSVRLPWNSKRRSAQAWRVAFPRVEAVPVRLLENQLAFELRALEEVGLVFIAPEPRLADRLQRGIEEVLPDVVRFTILREQAVGEKIGRVVPKIASALSAESRRALADARESVAKAQAFLASNDLGAAYECAKTASWRFRQFMGDAIEQARADWRSKRAKAYYKLLAELVSRRWITGEEASRLGHFPSCRLPKGTALPSGTDNFLVGHFFLLGCYYGARTDKTSLTRLCERASARAGRDSGLVEALRRGDFDAAWEILAPPRTEGD